MMKTEYTVITSSGMTAFEDLVQTYLNKGWECQGGISAAKRDSRDEVYVYHQAMIRSTQ